MKTGKEKEDNRRTERLWQFAVHVVTHLTAKARQTKGQESECGNINPQTMLPPYHYPHKLRSWQTLVSGSLCAHCSASLQQVRIKEIENHTKHTLPLPRTWQERQTTWTPVFSFYFANGDDQPQHNRHLPTRYDDTMYKLRPLFTAQLNL